MNPTLCDLIKLHIEQKFPKLVVQDWTPHKYDQIRISTASIRPMSDDVPVHSLIAITEKDLYWFKNTKDWWDSVPYAIADPTFFDLIDSKIEIALANRQDPKKNKQTWIS